MEQRPANDGAPQQDLRIVYWALAGEPLVLAAIAYALRTRVAASPLTGDVPVVLTGIFALAALGLLYVSFLFASGRYDQANRGQPRERQPGITRSFSLRVFAVATAAAPGVLGFVLCLLTGSLWPLAAFNGAAFLAAAMHVTAFSERG